MGNFFKKIQDILMPTEVEYVDVPVEEEEQQGAQQVAAPVVESSGMVKQVVNGSPVYAAASDYAEPERVTSKPKLVVHSNKAPEMKIQIYIPQQFDEVCHIADDIKDKKAAIVNYEKIDIAEQRRICDFLNGAVYVLDGEARRITDTMVLYVPDGVDVANCTPVAVVD